LLLHRRQGEQAARNIVNFGTKLRAKALSKARFRDPNSHPKALFERSQNIFEMPFSRREFLPPAAWLGASVAA
jgi:hypothetical protein